MAWALKMVSLQLCASALWSSNELRITSISAWSARHPCTLTRVGCVPGDQLNIAEGYRCVLVLCDALWLDPDGNATNGVEQATQEDFLRIDSMVKHSRSSLDLTYPTISGRHPPEYQQLWQS